MDLCGSEPLTGFEWRSCREPSLHPTEESESLSFGGSEMSKLAGRRGRCVVVSDGARTLDRSPTNRLAQICCAAVVCRCYGLPGGPPLRRWSRAPTMPASWHVGNNLLTCCHPVCTRRGTRRPSAATLARSGARHEKGTPKQRPRAANSLRGAGLRDNEFYSDS